MKPKAPNLLTPKDRLMIFMRGWKKGAGGFAHTDAEMAQEDFKLGHEAGRNAATEAYTRATDIYRATLSPLR